MGKFIIWLINVFAQINIIGMDKVVYFHHVLEDKFGRELNVCVLLDLILMIKDVFNVSMVKYGANRKKIVFVKMAINGMDSIAKKLSLVQEIEYGMLLMNNVSV